LKALNVLVTEDWQAKIADYGCSRLVADVMTSNVGTVAWMAPEMFDSDPSETSGSVGSGSGSNSSSSSSPAARYSGKADVFSFGMLIYEVMVPGEMPYQLHRSFEVPLLIKKGVRPTLPPTTPKPLVKIATACWQEKPSKRPGFDAIVQGLLEMAEESTTSPTKKGGDALPVVNKLIKKRKDSDVSLKGR
jgi:serine/threonine protein kinase